MLVHFTSRAFQLLVKTQIWIALCAWAAAASWYCIIEKQLLPFTTGILVALIVLCSYSWYYVTNRAYPAALGIALVSSVLCISGYALADFPKPALMAVLVFLSAIYMLPYNAKKKYKIVFRWIILSTIWTLFTCYFPLRTVHYSLNTALLFTYRLLFMGNLCFFFLLKDHYKVFPKEGILFLRYLLIGAQSISLLSIGFFLSEILAIVLCIPFMMIILFYKTQSAYSGHYFYSLGIDGLMIFESIFVLCLFLYG